MSKKQDTTERLIDFFAQRPTHLSTVLIEPNNVEVWENIFIFFFNEAPRDDSEKVIPRYWRKGSTDPRWDTLLYKTHMGALQALDQLVEDWRNESIELPTHKEAA